MQLIAFIIMLTRSSERIFNLMRYTGIWYLIMGYCYHFFYILYRYILSTFNTLSTTEPTGGSCSAGYVYHTQLIITFNNMYNNNMGHVASSQ